MSWPRVRNRAPGYWPDRLGVVQLSQNINSSLICKCRAMRTVPPCTLFSLATQQQKHTWLLQEQLSKTASQRKNTFGITGKRRYCSIGRLYNQARLKRVYVWRLSDLPSVAGISIFTASLSLGWQWQAASKNMLYNPVNFLPHILEVWEEL